MKHLIFTTLTCVLLCQCRKDVARQTKNSPEASTKTQSEALAQNFPLLPSLEPKFWNDLLLNESIAIQTASSESEKKTALSNIEKIASTLNQRHPFKSNNNSITLGGIIYNKTTRQIQIPATVHYPKEGDDRHPEELELILCSDTGRAHETLFTTATRPLHLEVLLHLAGFQKSSPPSTFQATISLPNHDSIPIEQLIISKIGDTLPKLIKWEFSGSNLKDFYPPDLTGDFIICWHAHDSVLRIQDDKIASGEIKLGIKKHQLLEQGKPITLTLTPLPESR